MAVSSSSITTTSEKNTEEIIDQNHSDIIINDEIKDNLIEPTSESGSGFHQAKKLYREQHFRFEWTKLFTWIGEKEDRPYCKLCDIYLTNNKPHLIRHENSTRHKKNESALKKQPRLEMKKSEFNSLLQQVKIAEIRILLFILQQNLPFVLISPLVELIKCVAVDSEIAKHLKIGKTKATETTKTILLEEANIDLRETLSKQKFSLIIDESTDVSTTKSLVLLARYFDFTFNKVRDRFLAMIELRNSDAESIFKCIQKCFIELKIPLQNCIGLASDNASVMTGKKSGVKALFLKENPFLFTIGCMCHSLHLCSSAAARMIPTSVEILARNIYLYFSHSPKRQAEYKEFQESFNVKTHKILKTSSTRWLSLENVVSRILEQWTPLQHFFLHSSFESDVNSDMANKIRAELNNHNKFYFFFLNYILNLTNKLNLEFQVESVRIHALLPMIKTYYNTILSNFIKREYILNKNVKEINFSDNKYFKEIKDVYVGGKAELFLVSENFSEMEKIELKECCKNYYKILCEQISSRINFEDKILNSIQGIDPSNLNESIVPLIAAMPNLVKQDDIEELDAEWRIMLNQGIVPKSLELEEYWTSIFQLKNALNEKLFPKLKDFISSLLCLPHSSAAAERAFSMLTLIKDKKRNCLDTSTVSAIMMCKEFLYETDVTKWVPPKPILQKYNKNLLHKQK